MREVPYDAYVQKALDILPRGAFLTVKSSGKKNTMTIGWGNIGYIWGRPMFMVLVRHSRYTYELIESAADFTVSFPLDGQLKEALNFCGTKSGRNYNKFNECNLNLIDGHQVNSPLIKECGLHYECEIKFKQEMLPEELDVEIDQQLYPEDDYHTLYFGEIVGCYLDK